MNTLSTADLDAIAERVVSRLQAAAVGPATRATSPDDIVTAREAMVILGVNTPAALSRSCKKLRVRRLGWNRYRRGDLLNAVARATHVPKGAGK